MESLPLASALLAGLAGSTHCFAMCGGMAGALGMRARATAPNAASAFVSAGAYQLGRIGGYALAGAAFGAAGAALQSAFDLMRLAATLRIASGVLMVLIALRLLVRWNALAAIERLGACFWRRVQPLAQRTAQTEGRSRALLFGLLWGWLPCGLVYSMLVLATTSGDALQGAGVMAAFGLGTLPSMLTSSVLAAQFQHALARRWPKILSGALLVAFGVWMIAAPVLAVHPAGHTH